MISDEVYLLEKIKCILKLHATDHNSKRKQIPTIVDCPQIPPFTCSSIWVNGSLTVPVHIFNYQH